MQTNNATFNYLRDVFSTGNPVLALRVNPRLNSSINWYRLLVAYEGEVVDLCPLLISIGIKHNEKKGGITVSAGTGKYKPPEILRNKVCQICTLLGVPPIDVKIAER